ncbi:MAG: hypothetical protein ABI693_21345 [Bryobacteraceae bacterium]
MKHYTSAVCRDTPVLVVTSSDSVRDRQSVNALGISGYFRKPSVFTEFMKLGSIVKSLLSASKDSPEPSSSE